MLSTGVDMQTSNRETRWYAFHSMALLTLALVLSTGMAASAQSTPPRGDNDTKGWQVADMDKFLDSHPEIAEQLRKDPTLIRNREFVEKHPALQEFLQTHPGVREEFSENPNAFMHRENRFDAREDDRDRRIGDRDDRSPMGDRDVTRGELASADSFMHGQPEI